jgi:cytoskeletal protein CcmA (bactofilin family)
MATLIGTSVIIEGEIDADEKLIVQGTVQGRIAVSQTLIVERSGVVKAEVQAETLLLSGHMVGRAAATSRVEITPEGRMEGDIRAPRILIADGAQFKGNVDMER